MIVLDTMDLSDNFPMARDTRSFSFDDGNKCKAIYTENPLRCLHCKGFAFF